MLETTRRLLETEWYRERPPSVRARIESHPFTQYYELMTTGQMVVVTSYSESDDGSCDTCIVFVDPKANDELFEFQSGYKVFGVSYEDLRPTRIPVPEFTLEALAEIR